MLIGPLIIISLTGGNGFNSAKELFLNLDNGLGDYYRCF